jgi:uncharacterized integral membrane protein (TIGR00698 family)
VAEEAVAGGLEVAAAPERGRAGSGARRLVPGLAAVAAIAAFAFLLGRLEPVVGGPVIGIALGMAVGALRRPAAFLRPGIAFAAKQVLQLAVVLLGTGLGLGQIVRTGGASLPVMLGTMAACLLGAWAFGSLLGVGGTLRTLVGVGTGICGASAVAATSTVLGAGELDVAYAISTIFLFNVVAVLLYPPLGHLLHLSQGAFGLWAGTAINDTSSVVAAAYTFGHAAGDAAVVVKLTRTTLIIPITLALAAHRLWRQHGTDGAPRVRLLAVVPWFVLWFLLAAVLHTLGAFSPAQAHALGQLALFLIVMALTAIGLSADFGQMRRTGLRPLVLGALLWATVGLSSLALQRLSGPL